MTDGEKQQVVHIYNHTKSISAINKAYGFSERSRIVKRALQEKGVDILRGKRKVSIITENEIVKKYLDGVSTCALSNEYGLTAPGVCHILGRNNTQRRDNKALNQDEEQQAIKMYFNGQSVFVVGDAFGVDGTTILNIIRRYGYECRPVGKKRKYELDKHVFDIINNESAAYFLGYIYADGCVVNNYTLQIGISIKDIEQLEKLKIFLSSNAPIKKYQAKTPQGNLTDCCRIDIHSIDLCSKLSELGIVKGRDNFYKTKAGLHKGIYRHFIRGLVDGDGAIDTTKRCNARIRILGQVDILDWTRKVFHSELGTREDQPIRQRAGICSLGYGGAKQAREIITWLYSNTDLYLPRKLSPLDWWQ
jgi:transposase-like protein